MRAACVSDILFLVNLLITASGSFTFRTWINKQEKWVQKSSNWLSSDWGFLVNRIVEWIVITKRMKWIHNDWCFLFLWSSGTTTLFRYYEKEFTKVSSSYFGQFNRGHLLRSMRGEVYYGQCTVRFVELIMPFLHGWDWSRRTARIELLYITDRYIVYSV